MSGSDTAALLGAQSSTRRSWSEALWAAGIGVLKTLETVFDYAPLICTQILSGSPVDALGAGTLAAVFVLCVAFLKLRFLDQPGAPFPKTLDVGQFLLFGLLWVLALATQGNEYAGRLLILWFNPFTTGGIALIQWVTIKRGRPFVFEYVQAQMPPPIWARLSSKKWFRDILSEIAMFWVRILAAMTLVVSIQPLIVTCVSDDGKADAAMQNLGNVGTVAQFVILAYGLCVSAVESGKRDAAKKLARDVKDRGLTGELLKLHGRVAVSEACGSHLAIRSISAHTAELDEAGRVLAEAFRDDELLDGFLDTFEGRLSFYTAAARSLSYFNLVLGCFDDRDPTSGGPGPNAPEAQPRCVMACVPVLSRSQDEVDVFNSYEAWLENGFAVPGATEEDFPLPDDDLFELGKLKKKKSNKLANRPYIYIGYFGADPAYKGRGYGRCLLRYIIGVAEAKRLPLVLETLGAFNISQYERYGFSVVDRVDARPDWVLMVRQV